MIYIVSLLVTVLVQFFIPAETPMVPLLVTPKNLLSANALFSMAIFASILVAYVMSGPVLIFLNPVGTLIFLSVMLLVGALFINNIPTVSKVSDSISQKTNFLKDIKNTLTLMSKTKEISRSLFCLPHPRY